MLCGRQNIALRGNSDNNSTDLEKDATGNHGNYRVLLDFRVDAGDKVLAEHLVSAPRNATYTSGDIQNQDLIISVNRFWKE